jgi:hypothetical protein
MIPPVLAVLRLRLGLTFRQFVGNPTPFERRIIEDFAGQHDFAAVRAVE